MPGRPCSVQRGLRDVPHPIKACYTLGSSEYGGHVEGGGLGGAGEVWLSLGPGSQRQRRRVWLPTCPGPRPQALLPSSPPHPPSWPTAPGWDAGPHFPEESERGLGQTQSLEVGQMLLGRSWDPEPVWAQVGHGLHSPRRAPAVSTQTGTHYPMLGATNAAPCRAPVPVQLHRRSHRHPNSGWRWHEAATRAQGEELGHHPMPLEPCKFDSEEDFPAGLLCHQQDVACFPEAQPSTWEMGGAAKERQELLRVV